jgi:hypothetical protein
MKYLELSVLVSQIENVFTKYDRKIPTIKPHKFKKHLTLIVGDWEFYFDENNEGFIFSSVVDSHHNDDPDLTKIKAYIICDLINNKLINY